MSISRRLFLGASAAGAASLAANFNVASAAAKASPPAAAAAKGGQQFLLNNIVDDGKLAIAQGIKAKRVVTVNVEDLLDDKNGKVIGKTPSNLDGTGSFDVDGKIVLNQNHECTADSEVPVPLVEGTVYDDGIATGMGGNTAIETDSQGNFIQQWVALSGTIRNCAGGETPWGSWLSCEEDVTKAGTPVIGKDGKSYTTKKNHGYVFEVFPAKVSEQLPQPIKAWGRATFEGAAIDPDLTKAYITEDSSDGLFYRWTAPSGKKIGARIAEQFGETDGVLQAAQVIKNGTPLTHYSQLNTEDIGKAYPVKWVDGGADRQAQQTPLKKQFPGATFHRKIEGAWPDANGLWFTLSYSDEKQVLAYPEIGEPDSGMIAYYNFKDETLTIKDVYEHGNHRGSVVPGHPTEAFKQFDGPDNIALSPWGSVVIAEDGENPCSLLSFGEKNGTREFARDLTDRGEWAGCVFNTTGNVLFGSVQSDCTYAFTGGIAKFFAN